MACLLKSADNRKLINLFFENLKTWMYGVLKANKQKLCIQEMLWNKFIVQRIKSLAKSYKIEQIKTNRKKGVASGAIFPNVFRNFV